MVEDIFLSVGVDVGVGEIDGFGDVLTVIDGSGDGARVVVRLFDVTFI